MYVGFTGFIGCIVTQIQTIYRCVKYIFKAWVDPRWKKTSCKVGRLSCGYDMH